MTAPLYTLLEEINARIDTDGATHIDLRYGAAAVHIAIGTVTTIEQVIDINGNIHPFSRLPAQAAVQSGVSALPQLVVAIEIMRPDKIDRQSGHQRPIAGIDQAVYAASCAITRHERHPVTAIQLTVIGEFGTDRVAIDIP